MDALDPAIGVQPFREERATPRRNDLASDPLPHTNRSATRRPADGVGHDAAATCRVLLVEPGCAHRDTLAACGRPGRPLEVVFAESLAEAREVLTDLDVDAVVVAINLPDGSGLDLTREIAGLARPTAAVVLGIDKDFDVARAALRAGADDYVLRGVAAPELARRLDAALDRKLREKSQLARVARLHRLCRKLNQARNEVSDQVDLLCNDLVTAYQELAGQLQSANQAGEFTTLIEDELDLEVLLRKTLEHLIARVGPSNAAIFLPATLDEYSLGGYVNYDCRKDAVDGLLDNLADTLAPRVAESGEQVVHLTTDAEIDHWTDGGLAPDALRGCSVVTIPCLSDDECLAVVTLFRRHDTPFTDEHLELLSGLGPVLGAALEKIIRIHHRTGFTEGMGDDGYADAYGDMDDDTDDDDGYAGPDGPEPNADDELPF